MATWKLSNQHKKSAIERQFWRRDDKVIIREEGFRWGTWYCESDEKPEIDLKNPDGFEVSWGDYEWELDSMDDGCWADTEAGRNCTAEDLEAFNEAWEEDYYDGVEALGWIWDDTEFHIIGPLRLENTDTGEEFTGEDAEPAESPTLSAQEINELVTALEFPEPEPELTDWFMSDTDPVRPGRYQVKVTESTTWPFPMYAIWDGESWDEDVFAWRGLAKDPGP